jgi:hypothetical protein
MVWISLNSFQVGENRGCETAQLFWVRFLYSTSCKLFHHPLSAITGSIGWIPVLLAIGLASPVTGTTITYLTPAGSAVSDGPIAANAIFDIEGGFATITLRNELANARSSGQLISAVEFSFGGVVGTTSLSSSSADLIQVQNKGLVADQGSGPTGWVLGEFEAGLILCVVCPVGIPDRAAPAREIIGPGPYSGANPSIAGNQSHNPLLNQVAVFTISSASITGTTTVNDVVFTFGTTFGGNRTTVGAIDPAPEPIPEPSTCALLDAGLIGFAFLARGCFRR